MRCYYEILDVDQSISAEKLKKAYYKISLKWHPDKNIDNLDEATAKFKEIQRAYKVLSNLQERAWYDKNRERILSMNENCERDIISILSNVIFCGFHDGQNGFYSVYNDIFNTIVETEKEAVRIKGETIEDIPSFGNSKSSYEDSVGKFYSFWESFSTKLSFHWKNKFDIDLTHPREIRRAMEKENKELRSSAKKEFNGVIRNFVATVKNQDPRVKDWKEFLSQKNEDNERKAILMKEKARQRHLESIKSSGITSQSQEISAEVENRLREIEMTFGEGDNNEERYCVCCDKYFKSDSAFNNHTKSKYHNKNYQALKRQMTAEDEALFNEMIAEEMNKIAVSNDPKSDINEEINTQNDIINNSDSNLSVNSVEKKTDDNDKSNNLEISEEKKFKKEKKRRRRPKEERTASTGISSNPVVQDDEIFKCERCQLNFSSKNKLFSHIKQTGHATVKISDDKIKNKGRKNK